MSIISKMVILVYMPFGGSPLGQEQFWRAAGICWTF